MVNFSNQDFGRIGLSFANWQKMANMDKSPFPAPQANSGVAPPTIGQEFSSLKSQLAAIPGAFQQASSGNFQQAEKMMAPSYEQPSVAPATTAPAPVIDNSYDYTSGIETSSLDAAAQGGAEIMSMFG